VRVRAFSACRRERRIVFGDAGQGDRRAVREFRDKRQRPTHRFNGLPQRGNHQVRAFFELGNAVLPDAELLGHADLRELACAPEFLQRHFLRDELGRAGLNLLATGRA